MIENQLRERLDAAIADEPPLGFDPLAAADDARRATRSRRGLLAGLSATVAAVAAVAVVTVTVADVGSPSGGQGGGGPAGSTGSPAMTTEYPSWGTPSSGPHVADPGPLEGRRQFYPAHPGGDPHGLGPRAERVANRVVERLPQVVPGVSNARPVNFGQEAVGDYSAHDDRVEGVIAFDDAVGATALVVKVTTPAAPRRGPCSVQDPGVTCREATAPDGSALLVYDGPGLRSVLHQRLDGSSVEIAVYDGDPAGENDAPRDAPPLDEAQLTDLVTDPELRL